MMHIFFITRNFLIVEHTHRNNDEKYNSSNLKRTKLNTKVNNVSR